MRSRTIREGSVGLLILVGLGLFGLLVAWLRGFNPGSRSYHAVIDFGDVGGMQVGAPVRYRGVGVGKVTAIQPAVNGIAVEIEITSASLTIPKNVLIQANQSGLIGETSIDITPNSTLPETAIATNPLAADCKGSPIICDGDRLSGEIGVNFNALIGSTVKLTNLFADPAFFNDIRILAKNTSNAAAGVAVLSREVTTLTRSIDRELTTLSATATTSTAAVGQAANQISLTATQVNNLLVTNRATLVSTLDNLNRSSSQLQSVLTRISPVVENGEFVQNLETLSANAAQASANLRNLSEAVGTGDNLLLLQQTLESARATFQNAQKITADLDELTGDPTIRQNLRDLINGLSGLVSSTQQLQQQTQIAQVLTPVAIALNTQENPLSPPESSSSHLTLLNSERRVRIRPFTITNPTPRSEEPSSEANP